MVNTPGLNPKIFNTTKNMREFEVLPCKIYVLTLSDSTPPCAPGNIFFVLSENSLRIVCDETNAGESLDFDSAKIKINQDEEISLEKGKCTYTAQITNGSACSLKHLALTSVRCDNFYSFFNFYERSLRRFR